MVYLLILSNILPIYLIKISVMRISRFFYLIAFFLVIPCCGSHVSKISEPKEFSELAKDAYFLRNDNSRFIELCNQLNDTIANSKILFCLDMLTSVNEIDKSVSWAFHKRKQEILRISDRLIFKVCIKDSGDLYVNYVKYNLSEIKNMASQYIYYPNDIDKGIIQKKVEIEGLGTIDVSIAGMEICCDAQKNNGLSQNEWKLLFDCIHEFMLVIEEQRDKISIERFGQKYESLSFDKKVIFADIIGYPLKINFLMSVMTGDCTNQSINNPTM